MYTYVYYLVINRHNICDLHWVPWISFSTRCILPFDSPGSVGPSCCSCSRGFHWSYSGHQFCVWHGNCARWDVGCGMWFRCFAMGILMMFTECFPFTNYLPSLTWYATKKLHWNSSCGSLGLWVLNNMNMYMCILYIFMFAWKQQIVDTFRGTCQVCMTENPPQKSIGCRTHQGTSCTSQNRPFGHQLADATVWIWTCEFKPTCLRYLDATIVNHGGILVIVYKHISVTLVIHLIFTFIWYCSSSLIVFGYSRKIIHITCWDQSPFILQVT